MPAALAVASVAPSGLKPTPSTLTVPRGPARGARDRDSTSQSVAWPSAVTAASVSPVRREGERLDLTAGIEEWRPDRRQLARVPERDALLLEADRDQPAVGAEPPGMAVVAVVESPVVRERERPPEPALAREIPGDRRAVVTHRVERLPVAD